MTLKKHKDYLVGCHVCLDVMLSLDVGDILEPGLQLRVLILQIGNFLLERHQLFPDLHVSTTCLKESFVSQLESLNNNRQDLHKNRNLYKYGVLL